MWVAVARGIILDSEAGNGLCNGFFMDDIFSPDDALCNMSTSSRVRAWAPISSTELEIPMRENIILSHSQESTQIEGFLQSRIIRGWRFSLNCARTFRGRWYTSRLEQK